MLDVPGSGSLLLEEILFGGPGLMEVAEDAVGHAETHPHSLRVKRQQ